MRYRLLFSLLALTTLFTATCQREKPPVLLQGSITIHSAPDSAVIRLDGATTGAETPNTLLSITAGRHVVTLEKPGYFPWSVVVDVPAGRDTTLVADLTPAPLPTGGIAIRSLPTGADIVLDGVATGQVTDGAFEMTAGWHEIRLRKAEYQPWVDSVLVMPNELATVSAPLILLPGTLIITSSPAGAAIHLDYVQSGLTTPALLAGLRTTAVFLRLTLSGHFPYEGYASVAPGDTTEVTASLDPAPSLTLAYALGETLFSVGLDGCAPHVLAVEPDGPAQ